MEQTQFATSCTNLFLFIVLFFFSSFFYEDVLNGKKERTVASALGRAKKRMEIVHELEKGIIILFKN